MMKRYGNWYFMVVLEYKGEFSENRWRGIQVGDEIWGDMAQNEM